MVSVQYILGDPNLIDTSEKYFCFWAHDLALTTQLFEVDVRGFELAVRVGSSIGNP